MMIMIISLTVILMMTAMQSSGDLKRQKLLGTKLNGHHFTRIALSYPLLAEETY